MYKYSVVLFPKTNEVDVISTSWLLKSTPPTCYWPPYKDSVKISKAAYFHEIPQSNWKRYVIRQLNAYGKSLITSIGN